MRRLRLGRQPPLVVEPGPGRVAVDHHDRRAQQQRRDQRVPHHPGGRRELEQRAPGLRSQPEALGLEVLDEHPAVPVHDRLRQAGRARGEQHVERVVERDRLELQRALLGRAARPSRWRRAGRAAPYGTCTTCSRVPQPLADRGDLRAAVDLAVAVGVAGDREQHLRLDLGDAREHAARAELRRAAGPDRAEARGGDERDERLGHVRQVADDAVAGADAEPHAVPRGRARPARAARRR